MSDLLPQLTADRLEALAGICHRRIAGINETAKIIGATMDDTRTRMGADLAFYSQLAAIVRTLADAQKAASDAAAEAAWQRFLREEKADA
jgi:hypothetical protein